MNERTNEIRVLVNDDELTRLDDQRGVMSRAGYVRSLLREPPSLERIADRQEVLCLLSEQARAGKVTAAIALLRALRPEDALSIDDELDRLLGG